jgi:hypothetical protein
MELLLLVNQAGVLAETSIAELETQAEAPAQAVATAVKEVVAEELNSNLEPQEEIRTHLDRKITNVAISETINGH